MLGEPSRLRGDVGHASYLKYWVRYTIILYVSAHDAAAVAPKMAHTKNCYVVQTVLPKVWGHR